jgi:hypothetical protein
MGAGFVGHWLMPTCYINDAEAPVSEVGVLVVIIAAIVRTAMCNRVGHPPQNGFRVGRRRARHVSGNATHNLPLPVRSRAEGRCS